MEGITNKGHRELDNGICNMYQCKKKRKKNAVQWQKGPPFYATLEKYQIPNYRKTIGKAKDIKQITNQYIQNSISVYSMLNLVSQSFYNLDIHYPHLEPRDLLLYNTPLHSMSFQITVIFSLPPNTCKASYHIVLLLI